MSVLPDILPWIVCKPMNIKFMDPDFCNRRMEAAGKMGSSELILNPSILSCLECNRTKKEALCKSRRKNLSKAVFL